MTETSHTPAARSLFARAARFLSVAWALGFCGLANAVDTFSGTYNTISGLSSGEQKVGSQVTISVSNVINLILGPGMWVVMALGAMIATYGVIQKQKEVFITGIITFIFAMVLRAVFAIAA